MINSIGFISICIDLDINREKVEPQTESSIKDLNEMTVAVTVKGNLVCLYA